MAGVDGAVASPWNRLTVAFAAIAIAYTFAFGWALLRTDPRPPVSRFSILIPEEQSFRASGETFDVSRDGSFMVYRGSGDDGQSQLWLRRWDALDAVPIPGTTPTNAPAISPNGREVAFVSAGSLRVVPLEGGVSRTLTGDANCCVRWSPDGAWVYYNNLALGLSRVPSDGGSPEVVTTVDTEGGDFWNSWVDPLPGGRSAVYTANGPNRVNERVQAVDLETGEIKDLTSGTYPRYSPTGHLLFVEAGGSTLLAAPFDVDRLEFTGSAVPVVEGLLQHPNWFQFYALSQSGRLVYRTGAATTDDVTPVWVERDGTFREIDPGWTFPYENVTTNFALSPNANRLVVSARSPQGTVDIYVKELDTGPLTRLTFEGAVNRGPTWSPDGRSVTFVSNRAGQDDLWMRRADGSGRAELVLDMDEPITEALYSPDGEWLLFILATLGESNFGGSIYGIRLGVDSVPTPLVVSEDWRAAETSLSPDGRWLAYYSNMLGDTPLDDVSSRVWVQPFPDVDSGSLWQISTTISDGPEWAHSGRELFYNSDYNAGGTQDFMVAEVSLEPTFALGQQRVLFSGVGYGGSDFPQPIGHERKVSLDDQRFVMLRSMGVDTESRLILVENFFEELKERVPN